MENYSCKTKYPILLVHGMGFRDGRICYWGRIPRALEAHGAAVFFGGQEANASVRRNGEILARRLRDVLKESGAEKVNIIAHSKGGIEARHLVSRLKMGDKVASITTISTPHNGSLTMEKIMKLPKPLMKLIGIITDVVHRIGGDKSPGTYRCLVELTRSYMQRFNAENPDDSRVYYRSCAFLMKHWYSDLFMTVPYIGVKLLNGASDGFLTPEEVRWGDFRGIFTGVGMRGISHFDETDFRRMRLSRRAPKNEYEVADMRSFYIMLVSELKNMGL